MLQIDRGDLFCPGDGRCGCIHNFPRPKIPTQCLTGCQVVQSCANFDSRSRAHERHACRCFPFAAGRGRTEFCNPAEDPWHSTNNSLFFVACLDDRCIFFFLGFTAKAKFLCTTDQPKVFWDAGGKSHLSPPSFAVACSPWLCIVSLE